MIIMNTLLTVRGSHIIYQQHFIILKKKKQMNQIIFIASVS